MPFGGRGGEEATGGDGSTGVAELEAAGVRLSWGGFFATLGGPAGSWLSQAVRPNSSTQCGRTGLSCHDASLWGIFLRPMSHRPTRKYKVLKAKLEDKQARSRMSGNKARRMKKWLEEYEKLNASNDGSSDDEASDD